MPQASLPDTAATLSPAGGRRADHGRLLVIDVLRMIAALAVVMYHLTPPTATRAHQSFVGFYGRPLWDATRFGWLGVPLFFLISGLVISMSSWGRTLAQFATSRVARLWPAYTVAVLLTAAVLARWPVPGTPHLGVAAIVTNLTMLQMPLGVPDVDSVYWSLITELKFYLIFAVVVWRGCTYRRVVLFCFLWLTGAVLAQEAAYTPLTVLLQPVWAPFFVGGVVLYLIHRFGGSFLMWCMLCASWALALQSTYVLVAQHAQAGEPIRPLYAELLVTGFYAVLVATALGWLRWLRWRRLTVLGALSYPLYLLHNNVGNAIIVHLPEAVGWAWTAVIAVLVLLVVSYAMTVFVEKPGSKIIRRGLTASFARIRATDTATPAEDTGRAPDSAPSPSPIVSAPRPSADLTSSPR